MGFSSLDFARLPLLILMLENPEWLIILAIVVVLFGGSRLGQIGGSLGQSIREFKRAVRDEDDAGAAPAAAPLPSDAGKVIPVNQVRSLPAAPIASPPPRLEYLPDAPARASSRDDPAPAP